MTLKCDLDLSYALCTHYLTQRNIWVKFSENCLKGSGDMERTGNSRVNPLTFTLTCNLDFESR